jgi:hypothetical protein
MPRSVTHARKGGKSPARTSLKRGGKSGRARGAPDDPEGLADEGPALGGGARDVTPSTRPGLPRLVAADSIETCSLDELLLLGLAGEMGGSSHRDPIEALANRIAVEIESIGALTDDNLAGDTLLYIAQRARVLAEMIRRAHVGHPPLV